MRITLLFSFFLLLVVSLWGQKYSNEFLSIGVGAKAQGMGNAVVAGVDDVTAAFWNPAGLAVEENPSKLQLGAMHAEWFAGVGSFDYLGARLPLGQGEKRLGISLIRFGVDEIPNTLSLYENDGTVNYDNLREFSAADYALLLSYAQPIRTKKGQFLIGGNLKVIHRRIGPFANSWGFGLDAGLQYRVNHWRFGFMGKDLTSTFNAWTFSFTEEERQTLKLTNNEVPINSLEVTSPQLLFGIGHFFDLGTVGLSPELDFVVTTDGRRNTLLPGDPFSLDLAFGLEASYKDFLFLRAGVTQFQEVQDFDREESLTARPSFGVGLRLGALQVDYAFSDQLSAGLETETSPFSHIISLQLDIGRAYE